MKNLIIFVACIFLCVGSIAQTTIKIILKTDLKIDSVDMYDVSFREVYKFNFRDTLDIKFHKQNIDLYNIRYFVKNKVYKRQIWLDTGSVIINAHTNSSELIIDTVINSPVYYSVINYLKTSHKLLTARDTTAHNNFLLSEIQNYLENPRSIAIAFDFINLNQNNKSELLRLKFLLSSQKADLSWFLLYPMAIDRMNKILSIKSVHFTDFKFINRQNKITGIDIDKDDYYLLDFWFVGCTTCAKQHKVIKNDYLRLRDKKIAVIGVSTDRNFKIWSSYLSEHNYNWDNYREAAEHRLSDYLGINAFPAYVLINKKGEIIGNYDSWERVVNALSISL